MTGNDIQLTAWVLWAKISPPKLSRPKHIPACCNGGSDVAGRGRGGGGFGWRVVLGGVG